MVFTAAQTTAFFEDANQMAIPHATVVQLSTEGIDNVEDLGDFDKDNLNQVATNLRRPPGGAAAFTFGAKSQKRLLAASNLVSFYENIGRDLTAANMRWIPTMKNFEEQWKALVAKREDDDPDTPLISKALPIIKWCEAFKDHLHRSVGVRYIPLAYVIRERVTPPAICPPLAAGQPYSSEHGSIEMDLVERASHSSGLFRDDNATVYYKIEEATRGTPFAASIQTFQRQKDGRGAFIALSKQYAGPDKWEAQLKKMTNLLHTRKWKGQGNYTLERFCQHHRNAFVSMQACAEHVAFQLPNEHSRVGYLIDGIENNDPPLQAALANVEEDVGDGTDANPGKRNDFELAVAYILPKDPVARKRDTANKRGAGEISELTVNVSGFGDKAGIGKTGVHLRWHSNEEYKDLSQDQRKELNKWRSKQRKTKPDFSANEKKRSGSPNSQKREKKAKKAMVAAIEKQVEEKLNEKIKASEEDQQTDDEFKSYIMGLIKSASNKTSTSVASSGGKNNGATASATSSNSPITLRSILKKVKNPN